MVPFLSQFSCELDTMTHMNMTPRCNLRKQQEESCLESDLISEVPFDENCVLLLCVLMKLFMDF